MTLPVYNCSDGTELILKYLPNSVWRHTVAVFAALIAVVASLENISILFVLLKLALIKKTKPFHKILASLAVSDLLAGVTVAPILFAQLVSDTLATSCHVEKVRFYMLTITVGSSICTLGVISYDRYMHMVQLYNYKMPSMRLKLLVAVCWIIPTVSVIVHAFANQQSALYGVVIVIFLIVLTMVIIGSYSSILIALRRVTRQGSSSVRTNSIANERKTGFTVLIILTSYVITITPLIVHYSLLTLKHFNHSFDYYLLSKTYVVAVLFSVSNAVVNPLIIGSRTLDIKHRIMKTKDTIVETLGLEFMKRREGAPSTPSMSRNFTNHSFQKDDQDKINDPTKHCK